MKNILFLLSSMAIGGTEKSLLYLLDTLSPKKYQVTVMLLQREGELLDLIPEWVKVIEAPNYQKISYDFSISPFKLAIKYFRKGRLIKAIIILVLHIYFRFTKNRNPYYKYVFKGYRFEKPFDIAIAYEGPYDPLSSYVVNCITAKEKIQWIHFDVSKYLFHKETCKHLYNQFNRINVVSQKAKEALLTALPILSDKVFTVPNIVSKKRCKELAEIGEGFNDDYSGVRIITVGRLSEEKGQDIIPEVAFLLKQSNIFFRWYIIGEGNLLNRINERIEFYHVEENVYLLGAKKNPYPFFRDANIYVQTSIHEGFGLTLAEAKVFGLSIISTPCSGALEQLNGIENAVIVQRDSNALANQLRKMIEE